MLNNDPGGTARLSVASTATAQDIPADYQQVLTMLGKHRDYKANVLKVNIPRNDISVTVATVKTPTSRCWRARSPGAEGKNGLDVVAIPQHMTGTQPTIYFLHYWGTGPAEKLATAFKAAVNEQGKAKTGSATKQ